MEALHCVHCLYIEISFNSRTNEPNGILLHDSRGGIFVNGKRKSHMNGIYFGKLCKKESLDRRPTLDVMKLSMFAG